MKHWFKRVHRFLLPDLEHLRFAPYIWLIYLSIYAFSFFSYHRGDFAYLKSAAGLLIFLAFYFHGYWSSAKRVGWDIAAIALIGTWLATVTPGASVFFVYAGAFCCRLGTAKKASLALALLSIYILLFSFLTEQSVYFYLPAVLFMLMIGGVNIYQFEMDKKKRELNLSREEIRTLAKTAERERIARDLHDLIGHTFSVISLKAELASKLLEKDIDKAKREINELTDISRGALKQVREVVTGYRTSDLNTELAHAKYVLESNDIRFDYEIDDFAMNDTLNKELAIILKELVTNVLKHAQAGKVNASIKSDNGLVILQISDDGKGFSTGATGGFGLQGIQERLDKLAGNLTVESEFGTHFRIQVPLGEIQ